MEKLLKKRYQLFKKRRCFKSKIHVFVANKVEEKLYRKKMDPDTYGQIVVSKEGLVNQEYLLVNISLWVPVLFYFR